MSQHRHTLHVRPRVGQADVRFRVLRLQVIEIGWGKHPRVLEMTKAVAAFLSEHDVPFHPTTTPSLLAASRDALVAWLPLHH
jgi:hypothetical protein